jgi:hypothetical protein
MAISFPQLGKTSEEFTLALNGRDRAGELLPVPPKYKFSNKIP